ncbi:hypothetical protein OUY24_13895 [Nonomuraea ferruginea]|uniref:Uncharacterized protein n=1 Tax=Nonomuraea ferruginea TaxID=46174 RepID=A0ABT4SXD4_9ACTN|nr:hypothetical protein [Nonomuraea ferruginea]MDA0641715.1 hypothetical protein [Nonomuraea ferruginea]
MSGVQAAADGLGRDVMLAGQGLDGGALRVGGDDFGGLVRRERGRAAESLAGGLGGGDALAGVLADHVPLELQHRGQHVDHHLGAGIIGGQIDPRQQPGLHPQVQAAAEEDGPQGQDVGDRAKQAGGVGDADGVADCGLVQQLGEPRPVQGELAAGGGRVLVDGGAGGDQRGQGVPPAGVGLLVGGVSQVDAVGLSDQVPSPQGGPGGVRRALRPLWGAKRRGGSGDRI